MGSETQTASSGIWTRVVDSISCDDNRYDIPITQRDAMKGDSSLTT